MNLFVDTSVWSLALRRDTPPSQPEPKARAAILSRFSALPFLVPDRDDHVRAAELHVACRRKGLQVGTIDVLLAALCVRYELTMLSTDAHFRRIAGVRPLAVWTL